MQIIHNYANEVSRLVQNELETPGLFPVWSSPAARAEVPADALALIEPLIAAPAALTATPPSRWIPELLEAWRLGLVYLRDERSRVDCNVLIRAQRLILREALVGPFCILARHDVLLKQSSLGSHATVDGPTVLIASHFRQHVVLGPYVIITRSSAEPFVKVTRFARVDKSLLASNSSIEGSTHPEQIPLGARRRAIGVGIGPNAWIGQHVSVTHGGVVGRGVVVATHTSITNRTSDFVFVSGSPPREFPIDFNIRGLSAEEACEEGRKQGMMALHLPAFGQHAGAFATPTRLELDYPEHIYLRGLASENMLHFQRGVLALSMSQLFPDHRAQVSFAVGKSVRFTVELDRPLAASLYVPGDFAESLFRAGSNAGMFAERVSADFLAVLWKSLLRSAAPLPPHEPGAAPGPRPFTVAERASTAAPVEPVAAPELEGVVSGLVARLTNRTGPIDPDTPFHALGMDSLVAAELAVTVEARFNIVAPDVFRHNSVRKLTQVIRESL